MIKFIVSLALIGLWTCGCASSPEASAAPCEREFASLSEKMGLGNWSQTSQGVQKRESRGQNSNPFQTIFSPILKSSVTFFSQGDPDSQAPFQTQPSIFIRNLDGLGQPLLVKIALHPTTCQPLEVHTQSAVFLRGEFHATSRTCQGLGKFHAPEIVDLKKIENEPYGLSAIAKTNYPWAEAACALLGEPKIPSGIRSKSAKPSGTR